MVFTMILQQCRLLDYVIPAPSSLPQILSYLGEDVEKKPGRQFFTVVFQDGASYEKTVRQESLAYYLWSGKNEDLYNLIPIGKEIKTEEVSKKEERRLVDKLKVSGKL